MRPPVIVHLYGKIVDDLLLLVGPPERVRTHCVEHGGQPAQDFASRSPGRRFPASTGLRCRVGRSKIAYYSHYENGIGSLSGLLGQLQTESHIVEDRHMRIERVILENHRNPAILDLR
jgi:hypothetical protein